MDFLFPSSACIWPNIPIFIIPQELLDTLRKDPDNVRKQLSESLRKLTVLKVNEKKLSLRYTALLEEVQFLQKENNGLKVESTQMEVSVTKKVGELQRYKVWLPKWAATDSKCLNDLILKRNFQICIHIKGFFTGTFLYIYLHRLVGVFPDVKEQEGLDATVFL